MSAIGGVSECPVGAVARVGVTPVGQDEEAVEGVGDRAWPAVLRFKVELVREPQRARLGGHQIGQ